MTMPDPGTALHIARLVYQVTFSELTAAAGPVTFDAPDPQKYTFNFETGSTPNADGTVTVTSDTSSWSAARETSIATTMTAVCTALAAELGLTLAEVQAAVSIRRVWTMAANVQGAGASSGSTAITSVMTYP
jgi:hypothetical protein